MTPARSSPAFAIVFAIVFAVAYAIAVDRNYALFTYHPAIGECGVGVQQPKDGPAMYWYGWLATAGIAASVAGVVASWLPESLVRRLWSGWSWAVPAGVIAFFCYLLRNYFLR
jgi:hypothetical protein